MPCTYSYVPTLSKYAEQAKSLMRLYYLVFL